MKRLKIWSKWRVLFPVLVVTALVSCAGVDEAKWTEDVMLHDGRIVQIERRATMGKSDFPNPGRGSLAENELQYRPLGVYWHNAKRSAGWILSFDIFDGIPLLVIGEAGGEYCKQKGPGTYNAKFLQWKQGKWINVGQERVPLQLLTQNISTQYWGRTSDEDANGKVTWGGKMAKEYPETGRPPGLTQWLDDRRETCGQALPHLFLDN